MKQSITKRPGFAFGILMAISFILVKLFTAATLTAVNVWPMIGVSLVQGLVCGLLYGWVMKYVNPSSKTDVRD